MCFTEKASSSSEKKYIYQVGAVGLLEKGSQFEVLESGG